MYKPLGAIFIGLGLLVGGWGAVSYATRVEVIDVNRIHPEQTHINETPSMPILGALSILAGLAIVVFDKTETQ